MGRQSQTARLSNRFGLHMRPASEIVRIASRFKAEIHISFTGNRADARSVFELLILGARYGDLLEISAIGSDAKAALDALGSFFDAYSDPEELPRMPQGSEFDSFAA